jgi:hypothetical protein
VWSIGETVWRIERVFATMSIHVGRSRLIVKRDEIRLLFTPRRHIDCSTFATSISAGAENAHGWRRPPGTELTSASTEPSAYATFHGRRTNARGVNAAMASAASKTQNPANSATSCEGGGDRYHIDRSQYTVNRLTPAAACRDDGVTLISDRRGLKEKQHIARRTRGLVDVLDATRLACTMSRSSGESCLLFKPAQGSATICSTIAASTVHR